MDSLIYAYRKVTLLQAAIV